MQMVYNLLKPACYLKIFPSSFWQVHLSYSCRQAADKDVWAALAGAVGVALAGVVGGVQTSRLMAAL